MTETPSVLPLLSVYRNRIILWIVSAIVLSLLISLLLPKEYMSQASVLPANSKMMDKQRLFGENIQELYSAYGNSEDLDRLFAIMRSKEVLNAVADSFDLTTHYKLSSTVHSRIKTYKKFQKNIELVKTEYGEIRIRVWDKDSALAAQMANAIVSKSRDISEKMFTSFYEQSISRMTKELSVKGESQRTSSDSAEKKSLGNETAIIRNRMAEYKIAQLNPPPSLFILEKAEASPIADKPFILLNVLAGFVAAVMSAALWLSILYARRNS